MQDYSVPGLADKEDSIVTEFHNFFSLKPMN